MIASAYTIEEISKELKSAYSSFVDNRIAEYESALGSILSRLENVVKKYPSDGEMRNYLKTFSAFYEGRKEMKKEEEKKKLSELLSDINQKVHWRKLGMSSGKELPFKDFRSLREEIGGR
ncbi:MAG: hypothetical protein QME59_00640 [Candidatus Hydrothermarchaeota archaeon]|nr:hypothetical protein [Candidatus Hydrothermarchaeota archaeon]